MYHVTYYRHNIGRLECNIIYVFRVSSVLSVSRDNVSGDAIKFFESEGNTTLYLDSKIRDHA